MSVLLARGGWNLFSTSILVLNVVFVLYPSFKPSKHTKKRYRKPPGHRKAHRLQTIRQRISRLLGLKFLHDQLLLAALPPTTAKIHAQASMGLILRPNNYLNRLFVSNHLTVLISTSFWTQTLGHTVQSTAHPAKQVHEAFLQPFWPVIFALAKLKEPPNRLFSILHKTDPLSFAVLYLWTSFELPYQELLLHQALTHTKMVAWSTLLNQVSKKLRRIWVHFGVSYELPSRYSVSSYSYA